MKLANNLARLGTETAFAVSALAADWQSRGNRVYPFHLGDINILPPEPLIRGVADSIRRGKNGYCPGAGIPLLREQLAAYFGAQRGVTYTADNIAVQPGGKPVIAKFLQAVMNPGDEVLYPVPGFPIYHSQINYQGGKPVPYYYHAVNNGGGKNDNSDSGDFALDPNAIRAAITPNTRALIFNNYHNPTGAAASAAEIDAIAAIARDHNLWVLNDDAYFMIRYTNAPPQSILTRDGMLERVINLFTFSKQYAMTGWRIGAAIGPAEPIRAIATMNTNMESCTAHFIQQAIGEALAANSADCAPLIAELKNRRDALTAALNAIDGISVSAPPSAFYIYCDMSAIMRRKNLSSIDALMRGALHASGVSFCTGEHFGANSSTPYARFAFSGISVEDINQGATALKTYLETPTP